MNSLVLPIVTPLLTAAILLLAPRRPRLQRWISFVGSLGMAASAVSLFTTRPAGRDHCPASRRLAGAVRYHSGC